MTGDAWLGLEFARESVADELELGAWIGVEPDEETLSWVLYSRAAWRSRCVTVRPFTRREESRVTGADWLWWWEGDVGGWFGSLVQAKRLKPTASGVTFDYGYTPRASASNPTPMPQIERLLEAADQLQVPAVYLLYRSPALGAADAFRCPFIYADYRTGACTYLSAAVVNEYRTVDEDVMIDLASPVECLACAASCVDDPSLLWYRQQLADGPLRRALTGVPSTPARAAIRAILRDVATLRSGQFRDTRPDRLDVLHSGFPVQAHFERGIRDEPPYVSDAVGSSLADNLAPEEFGLPPSVGGLVIVRREDDQ